MNKKIKIILGLVLILPIIANKNNLSLSNENNSQNNSVNAQFKIVINNETSNVRGWNNSYKTWFYLDLTINGRPYNDNDFNAVSDIDYNDCFVPLKSNENEILLTNNYKIYLLESNTPVHIQFNFGTFYPWGGVWYHAQLASDDFNIDYFNQFHTYGNNGLCMNLDCVGNNGNNSVSYSKIEYKF